VYKKIIAHTPRTWTSEKYLNSGLQYFFLKNDPDKALAIYKKAIELAAAEGDIDIQIKAYFYRASLHQIMGDVEAMKSDFKAVLGLDVDMNEKCYALFYCGNALERMNRPDEAINVYNLVVNWLQKEVAFNMVVYGDGDAERNLELEAKAHYRLASVYFNKDQNQEAIIEFHKAIAVTRLDDKNRCLLYISSGVVCTANGEYKRARDEFTQALSQVSADPAFLAQAYYHRGFCFHKEDMPVEALSDLLNAFFMAPKEQRRNRRLMRELIISIQREYGVLRDDDLRTLVKKKKRSAK
jgi:tetratricopeptide (TPR) repeat protein